MQDSMSNCVLGVYTHSSTSNIFELHSTACWTASQLMSRDSEFVKQISNTCVELCDACAEECEKHQDMEHCKLCAQTCRKCAEECRKMAS